MKATLNWNVLKKAVPAFVLTATLSAGFVWAFRNHETLGAANNIQMDKNRFIQVQILGINDFHGQLDVTRKYYGRYVGRADYLAAYLKQMRAKNKNTLLVHSGDMIGGSPPISSFQQDEPTIDVLNHMGFDIGTLGNHEFDRGVPEMLRLIHGGVNPKTGRYFKGAQFPYICANVIDAKTGKLILPPYIIKKVDGVPIGFIGVVLSATDEIEGPINTSGVKFTNEVTAINQAAAELKKQGVKSIIVLAHDGGGQTGGVAHGDVIDIAKKIDPAVDVIFAGHTHSYLNTVVNGKLIVEAYAYGKAFSDVNLEIDPATKEIVSKKASIIKVYQDAIKPDQDIAKLVNKYGAKVAPVVNQVVGTASTDISQSSNYSGESAIGDLIADSQRKIMNTDFAFMNSAGIRSDIQAGKVTWGQLFTILPFKENIVKMTLSGDQIRRLLNQQWYSKGTNMLQISGLTYTWDGTKTIGSKVMNISRTDGTPIDPKASYTVAANSYLAGGGDGFSVFLEGKNRSSGPVDINIFENYVKQLKQPFTASSDGRVERIQ